MSQLFDEEWVYFGSWPGISLANSMIWLGQDAIRRFHDEFGFWKGNANIFTGVGQGATCHSYGRKAMFGPLSDLLDSQMTQDPRGIEEQVGRYQANAERYRAELMPLVSTDATKLANDALAKQFGQIRCLQHEMAMYDQFGIFTEDYFEERINELLMRYTNDTEERLNVFADLTFPWTLSTVRAEEAAILEAWRELSSLPNFVNVEFTARGLRSWLVANGNTVAERLANDFGWVPVFLNNPSRTPDYYLGELTTIGLAHGAALPERIEELVTTVSGLPAARKTKALALQEKLELSEKERALVDTYRVVMDARNEASYQISLGSLAASQLAPEIMSRLEITDAVFHVLYTDEIVKLLADELELDDIQVHERLEIAGYWYQDEQVFQEMSVTEARQFLSSQQSSSDSGDGVEADAIGTGASPGRANGRACVIRGSDDFAKFQAGDILVAESTTVDYVPLMRKAAGIITAHGGSTCHAAIVAREFGLPAIVGYPSATEVFDDGQILEFDASSGRVEVVSKT